MQKELTVQELENINLELFKDKPLDLISIGKNLLSSNRHEKAIEIFEFGLKTVIANNNNNEFHIDCAKFNYHYADALTAKLFESNDIFNNNLPDEIQSKEIKESSKTKEENNNNLISPAKNEKMIEENKNDMEDDENEEEEEDEDDDERIAFEHLAVAEKTLKTFLEKYDNIAFSELPSTIINYYLDLSDVYFKFGELELIKSDFKQALDFFNQSIKYKKAYDSKYSRAIAEVYFMMASACDADAQQALVFYLKTYLILLYHLKKEKFNENSEINLEFEIIAPEEIKLDKEILKVDVTDTDKIKGLKETLNDVVIKIEDVCEEIKLTKELITEKVAMNVEKMAFSNNYDSKKVVDISKSGIIKKKADIKKNEVNNQDIEKDNK